MLLTAALALLLMPGGPAGAVPVAQDEAEACVSGQQISSQVPQTEAPQVPESQPPAPETKAPEVPEETVPARPENASMIVPESEPVEDTYFSDVVFLGIPDGGLPSVQRTAGGPVPLRGGCHGGVGI